MGMPDPPTHWYDPFADIAWWVGAIGAAVTAGGPFIFNFVAYEMRAKALDGVYKKKGYRRKIYPDLNPEMCVTKPNEPNAMYERRPDPVVRRAADSNLFHDLGETMGSESPGPSNYRPPQKDTA